jgi:hypothetical protein
MWLVRLMAELNGKSGFIFYPTDSHSHHLQLSKITLMKVYHPPYVMGTYSFIITTGNQGLERVRDRGDMKESPGTHGFPAALPLIHERRFFLAAQKGTQPVKSVDRNTGHSLLFIRLIGSFMSIPNY